MKRIIHILSLWLICQGIMGQNSITKYEYWFDDNYPAKVSANVSSQETFRLETAISCTQLSEGIHQLHFRAQGQPGYWSPPASSFFYKIAEEKANSLAAYEYWLDNNYAGREKGTISGQSAFGLNTSITASALGEGIHQFHFRTKDNNGRWSATASAAFYKIAEEMANSLVAYEYWFDDDYAGRTKGNLSGETTFQLNTSITSSALGEGIHRFRFRTKDNNGHWSATASSTFYKIAEAKANSLVAYEYWVNDYYDQRVSKEIEGLQTFVLMEDLDISRATLATNAIHFRYKDEHGQWGSVASIHFWRPVEPGFTHIRGLSEVTFTNTSKYADKYLWDFGDDNTSDQVHPLHTYAEPGAYPVKLVVENQETKDSVLFYVEIEGIKRITNNRGGNNGLVSMDIHGGLLDETTIVKMVKDGTTIATHTVYKKEPGVICATFDLTDKTIGFYDIVITANDKEYIFEDGFEIEEAGEADPWIEFEGADSFIAGRWQTMTIHYGNRGNIDIYGLPIDIFMPASVDVELLIDVIDPDTDEKLEGDDNFFIVRKINGMSYNYDMKALSTLIPHVPAYSGGSISFRYKNDNSNTINFRCYPKETLNDYYFDIDLLTEILTVDRLFGYVFDTDKDIDMSCVNFGVSSLLADAFSLSNSISDTGLGFGYKQYLNFAYGVFAMENNCLISPVQAQYRSTVSKIGSSSGKESNSKLEAECNGKCYKFTNFWKRNKFEENAKSLTSQEDCDDLAKHYDGKKCCDEKKRGGEECDDDNGNFDAEPVRAWDPNEIVGPMGYGDENYIAKRPFLSYTVYFENDAEEATAPAQEIILKNVLDLTKFDPETFSFGTFTFRDITIEAVQGEHEFSKDIDMRELGENIIIRVSATFDKETGEINWYLIALDPVTMGLTESPYIGILYPNTEPPIGEGNVTYRVALRESLPHGTVVENQADIIFDLNEAIITNVHKNTLDYSAPESQMFSYEITDESHAELSWVGSDTGSGIQSYRIYVSENDGEYETWLYDTVETSAVFEGTPLSNYKFYVVATDNVGNVESKTEEAELSFDLIYTHIDIIAPNSTRLTIIPNPVDDTALLSIDLEKESYSNLLLYNTMGEVVMTIYKGMLPIGKKEINIDVSGLSPGIYLLELQTKEDRHIQKVIVR